MLFLKSRYPLDACNVIKRICENGTFALPQFLHLFSKYEYGTITDIHAWHTKDCHVIRVLHEYLGPLGPSKDGLELVFAKTANMKSVTDSDTSPCGFLNNSSAKFFFYLKGRLLGQTSCMQDCPTRAEKWARFPKKKKKKKKKKEVERASSISL